MAAATAAHPRAVAGDASSNTFSYAAVGLRRAAHSCHTVQTSCRARTTKLVHLLLLLLRSPENMAGACSTRTAVPHSPLCMRLQAVGHLNAHLAVHAQQDAYSKSNTESRAVL